MEPALPPVEELEAIRQSLIEQITEAEQLFAAENNGHELLTSRAALKCIEEAIKSAQEREVA
jgi:hypothetical protein